MNRNDLAGRLLETLENKRNVAIVVSVLLTVVLYAYYEWQPADPGPPETEMVVSGPVAPQPKVEDHVAAVMRQENATFTTASPGGGTMTEDTTNVHLYLVDLPPRDNEGYFYAKCRDNVCQYIDPPSCPTYDALKRAGVEIVCTNAFGTVPSVNYWPQDMPMACSRIKKVVIHDKRIDVERK